MVYNSFYDMNTLNAEYLFYKILFAPERVKLKNWNNFYHKMKNVY